MPLIKIELSKKVSEIEKDIILTEASNIIIEVTGKSASHMMAIMNNVDIKMASSNSESAFVEIRGIGGLSLDVNNLISEKITQLLNTKLNIDIDRIYLNFIDIAPSNWGWKGKTFA